MEENASEGAGMYSINCRKRFAQVAVVAVLTCSAVAGANDCAGGADATGNDCTGEQAVRGSEAESHSLYLQGQTAFAELRAARAKQRLVDAAAALRAAEAGVKSAEAELKTARMALKAEQKQQSFLADKAR
jgi:hypothetical protein